MIDTVLSNLREYWMVHSLLLLYTFMLAHHAWTGNRKTCLLYTSDAADE